MSAAPPFDGFEERRQPALGPSAALALAVHLVLFAILFVGIRWESHPPAAMVVELWPAEPAPAPKVEPAPPPKLKPVPKVEPPPPPPKAEPRIEKPDIAIKAPPKPKPEPKPKPPPPKPEPKPKPKPRPKPNDAAYRKQMQEQLAQEQQQINTQRQEAELSALLASDAAAARSKALAAWADKIRAKIRSNIVLPPGIQGNPEAVFQIVLLPTAEVLRVDIKKSSNNRALDDAIVRAILKSSPLPKPDEAGVFDRRIEVTYRPFDQQ
ncbi:MAG TPA: energy transducer TonB [Burkholderiales bacterium]|nr:energy transducer TonB [Burkholderiales bacterium]